MLLKSTVLPRARRTSLVIAALSASALLLSACGGGSENAESVASDVSSSASEVLDSASSEASSALDSASSEVSSAVDSASSEVTSAVDSATSAATDATGIAGCSPAELQTKTPGKLTLATSEPAYEPWMVDNDPSNKQGYESAVAYAVAAKLGFADTDVTWTRISFDAAISPAPKDFDFNINQFSISEDRKKAVDFSSGYYDVTQAVVAKADSPIAGATSVAELKDAALGAMLGTTSLKALEEQIAPTNAPTIFDSNDAAIQALKNDAVVGIVVDLPTAFYMSAAQLDNGIVVGQLPNSASQTEQFGLLLEKDSPITDCATQAVDALRADGTLDALSTEWLAGAGAPVLS